MRTFELLLLAGLVLLCGVATGGCRQSEPDWISIEGSDTMVNLVEVWAEDFMADNPGTSITIKGGGSGAGIASLINGTTNLAASSRDVKDEEIAAGRQLGVDIVSTPVARDGIAIMVNGANPLTALSIDDLGAIYRGEITDWSEVGGSPGSIVLLGRDSSSGTYEFFQGNVVGKGNLYSTSMLQLQSNQAIVDELRGNPSAIGFVGMGFESPDLTVLEMDGVAATFDSVKDGTYPLSRLLFLDSNGQPQGVAKEFLDWVRSDVGQQLVQEEGFVAL